MTRHTRRVRVWLSGDWSALGALYEGLARQPELVLLDGGGDVVAHGGRASTAADVVLYAARRGTVPRDELAALREHTGAPILLLSPEAAPELIDAAIDAEAADVLLLPQAAEAVGFAALKAARTAGRSEPRRQGRVITVFSPKGGTGKSVTSCNLAVAMAQAGARTLLLDLDLQFGDAAIMFGLEPVRTLHDVVAAPGDLDADKLAGYVTRHSSGVDVLAAPLRPEDAELVSDARVAQLIDAACAAYDAVIVDTSPHFHGALLAALDRTDEVLLICAPDVPTLKNVRLTLETLELLNVPGTRVRLVLNRASARVGLRTADVAAVLERPVDIELPEDEAVPIGVNRGTPAVLYRGDAPYSRAVAAAAQRLLGLRPAPRASQSRARLLPALGRTR